MRFALGTARDNVEERLEARGVSRRQFLKYCGVVAAAMGMSPAFAAEDVAAALTGKAGKRLSVIYLEKAECTGCSEAFLRSTNPFIDELLFDTISLDYQETIMAAAGHQAEEALFAAAENPDGFICIVEGAIPAGDNGIYGKVNNHTMLSLAEQILPKAKAVIGYGTCAAFGGIQAAAPNPTGSKGLNDCMGPQLKDKLVNVAGCPPNPINLVGTIVYYIKYGKLPPLDEQLRPVMFFGLSVHQQCERLHHFNAGRFAQSFASEEARKGWCLYNLGCKGPQTYNNCPRALFNGVNWPVRAGHPCIGCSEPNFWDQMAPFYS